MPATITTTAAKTAPAGLKLNKSQKKAIEHKNGPLLIIAGAGTGKTRVITERIVWLIDKKLAKPSEILALTFTQKAAQEMEERVDIAMPYGYEEIWISTFHSFCDRILRQEAIYIGLDPNYTLMTQAQEYVYFRSKLFDLSLDRFRPHGNPTKFIQEMLKHFSRLSDEDVNPSDYEKFIKSAKGLDDEQIKDFNELAMVYKEYADMKEKDSKLGFADLVRFTLRLFRERPNVLKRYQKQFKYILVDEFQDTNFAQNELVKLLAGKEANVAVVGDDDQAIYKFRGAAISNILEFKKSYPEYAKVVLTENYRSKQDILDSAYKLIRMNDPYRLEVTEKIDKRLLNKQNASNKDDQIDMLACSDRNCVRRIHAFNEADEAEAVSQEILKLTKESKYNFSDIAMLVRANDHSAAFAQAFRYHGIPFSFPGPKGLYNRAEIKDLVAYLRLLANYTDNISLYKLLTMTCSSVSTREFIELQRLARLRKISLFEILEEISGKNLGLGVSQADVQTISSDAIELPSNVDPKEDISALKDKILSKNAQEWITKLMDNFEKGFKMVHDNQTVGQVMYDFVVGIGYIQFLTDKRSDDNDWKIQNISKFFNILKKFERETDEPSVYKFIDYLQYAIEVGEDPQIDIDDLDDRDAVKILTIHGAKGLEFPVVFMPCLVNERFPTRRRSDVLPIPEGLIKEVLPEGDEHIQEERRLCYVGMTRARNLLYLTSADYYGEGKRKKKQSIFLNDLGLVAESVEQKLMKSKKPEVILNERVIEDLAEVPADIKKAFLGKLTKNLSYSHISTFNACAYQFYFRYFLEVPGMDAASKSFGLSIHNTLKELYERLVRFKEGVDEHPKLPDLNDFLAIYQSKWQSKGYESKKQEKIRFEAGKKALEGYFKKFFTGKENPIWLEGKFHVDLDDIRIRGTVDRLDKVGDDYEIIDYKTGKLKKRKDNLEDNLQLGIYSIALEKVKNIKANKASLIYVESQDKLSVTISEELKERAKEEVIGTLNEIKKLEFPPKPGMLCKFCDYRNVCDYAPLE